MEVIPSKCKNCGSELIFSPEKGCLVCKHCDTNYYLQNTNIDTVLVRQYDYNFHPNELNQKLQAYRCDMCGRVYYKSAGEHSKTCTNCGSSSSTMVTDNGYCADGIIPFKIDKQTALKELKKYLSKNGGIPKELKGSDAEDALVGEFVPVWNFSYNVYADYNASVGKVVKSSSGSYYNTTMPVFGDKYKRINSLDECACTTDDDGFLELFDENDYARIIPYAPEYTYGYQVRAIDKDIHEYYNLVTKKAENEYENYIRREIHSKYKDITDIHVESRVDDVFFNFTYIPIYTFTDTRKRNPKKYYVSGTTGKVASKANKLGKSLGRAIKLLIFVGVVAFILYLFFGR